MKKFIEPIPNQRPLSIFHISAKQARILLSIHENEQVSFDEIARVMGLHSKGDARNQIKVLEKKGLISDYGKEGRIILWSITPKGINACREIMGQPQPDQAAPTPTLATPDNEEEFPSVKNIKTEFELTEKALEVLQALPCLAGELKWFRAAALDRLNLKSAA